MAGLMIQGTTSDAGKSILVAGLCRVFKRKGFSVAPFKPQNMALNSAVTLDGGEIGRAQALQAAACGLELHTDFNPVLLKPSSDMNSQVIINGKAVSQLAAKEFGNIKALAFQSVLEAYRRLTDQYDLVIIEGAGSPAEVNLRKNDIANMGFAEEVDCPVILVSDIDRGGVFAHLTGTLNILSKTEQQRIKGFVINKFRGHLKLLQGGLDWLEENTRKPVIGVLPFIQDLKLDAEDAVPRLTSTSQGLVNIKVIVLPRISNHTDFEPLSANPKINFEFVREAEQLVGADLVIIPGSKNVRDDLDFILSNGWKDAIEKHCRYGGKLLGICGGFQMLGERVDDLDGIESTAGTTNGLGLFSMTTELKQQKDLKRVSGEYDFAGEKGRLTGYEIHCGQTTGKSLKQPFCHLQDQHGNRYADGAISDDQQIIGTYLHGLFENKFLTESVLFWASGKQITGYDWQEVRENELERLADVLEEHLDLTKISQIVKPSN
jgi:adenosylcobyric acid synthase